MNSLFKKSVIVVSLISSATTELNAAEKIQKVPERMPASMGALGDSMTAGALAMFRRQDFVLPWTELLVGLRGLAVGITGKLAPAESRKLSWSSGYDTQRRVESHAYRLTQIQGFKKQIPTFNAAVTGDESAHVLNGQLGRLNEWSKKNVKQEYPDYVTLMVGPNDACASTTAEMIDTNTYYANITKIVDEVLTKSPDTKLVIGSIPNIELLRGVAKDARLYWGVKCEALWKATKLCPTLTTISDPYERAIVFNRINDYNNALEEVVEKRRAVHGDRIRFAEQTFKEVFNADELSVDCFHPNKQGQARIANATWQASWWTDEWAQKREQIIAGEKARERARCATLDYSGKAPRKKPGCF